jgi:hypothetical protein
MNTEVNDLLNEVNMVLKEARNTFRKNSDICRLSEAAIKNFVDTLQLTYDSVSSFAMEEITSLTDELTKLRGGMSFIPSIFENLMKIGPHASLNDQGFLELSSQNSSALSSAFNGGGEGSEGGSSTQANTTTSSTTSTNPVAVGGNDQGIITNSQKNHQKLPTQKPVIPQNNNKIPHREDMWLSVQRYKVAVRHSQEALCVLISDSMDLELQQQILTNRVHNTFTYIIENYFTEELTLSSDVDTILIAILQTIRNQIDAVGVPNPVLQSPFAKLNPALFMSESMDSERKNSISQSFSRSRSLDNEQEEQQPHPLLRSASTVEYDDFMNSVGIFSFTTLFKEPLPTNPGVIKSGYLLAARSSEVKWNENSISSLIHTADEMSDSFNTCTNLNKNGNIDFDHLSSIGWKTAYVIATSDGYFHIIFGKKSDIPDRSFYMKVSHFSLLPIN